MSCKRCLRASSVIGSLKRQALIHNIRILCPIVSNYGTNCYNIPTRLFVIGGNELRSKEGKHKLPSHCYGNICVRDHTSTWIDANSDYWVRPDYRFRRYLTTAGKCESLMKSAKKSIIWILSTTTKIVVNCWRAVRWRSQLIVSNNNIWITHVMKDISEQQLAAKL